MATAAWDDDDMVGGTNADLIDDKTQVFRGDIKERVMQGGGIIASETPPAPSITANNDGKHAVGWETQTDQDDLGYLTLAWDFGGTNPRIRHYGGSHVSKADMTEFIGDIGPLAPTTAILFKGLSTGVWQRIHSGDSTPATGYIKRILYEAPDTTGAPDRSVVKVRLTVGTRPVGTNLIVELRKRTVAQRDALTTDPFVDGSSTAFTDGVVTLVASSDYAVTKTLSSAEAILPGEQIVAKYNSVGSTTPTQDVTISTQVE